MMAVGRCVGWRLSLSLPWLNCLEQQHGQRQHDRNRQLAVYHWPWILQQLQCQLQWQHQPLRQHKVPDSILAQPSTSLDQLNAFV